MDPSGSGTCMSMASASDVASEIFTKWEQVLALGAYLQPVSKSS